MSKQTILIIGAGSTGLATALEIALSGKAKVIVLEKNFVGSGQTGQCCGLVRNFYNVREMIVSANYSMKEIVKICRENPELKYEEKGLLVIDDIMHKKIIQENVQLLKSLGVKATYLEGDGISEIHPYLITKNSCAGYDPTAGYVNPQLIIDYLKKECVRNGVQILEQTQVLGVKKRGNKFIVKTAGMEFVADKLFNATAGYTNNINKMLGFSLPVKTIKINNAFYRLPSGPQSNLIAIADFKNCFYMIPHEDFVDVSSMTLDLKQIIDLGVKKPVFDYAVIEEDLILISKRIKDANKSAILGGFGSHIDVTSDYYPILSKIDEIPGYYCAAGFSGTGFKHFPMVGKIMKEIILEEDFTFRDLVGFFRYDRFKMNKRRKDVHDSYFVLE